MREADVDDTGPAADRGLSSLDRATPDGRRGRRRVTSPTSVGRYVRRPIRAGTPTARATPVRTVRAGGRRFRRSGPVRPPPTPPRGARFVPGGRRFRPLSVASVSPGHGDDTYEVDEDVRNVAIVRGGHGTDTPTPGSMTRSHARCARRAGGAVGSSIDSSARSSPPSASVPRPSMAGVPPCRGPRWRPRRPPGEGCCRRRPRSEGCGSRRRSGWNSGPAEAIGTDRRPPPLP
jgi:hypothetical protein